MLGVGIVGGVGRPGNTRSKGGASWKPDDLGAALLEMWDAEQAGTLTMSGAAVTSWASAKTGNTMTQSTGASRPAYAVASFNGRPGLTFDGADDCLTMTGAGAILTGGNPVEIWALVDQTALPADTGNRRLFTHGGGSASDTRELLRFNTSGLPRYVVNVGNGSGSAAAENNTGGAYGKATIRARSGGSTVQVDVNGSLGVSAAVTPSIGSTRARIGANSAASAGAFFQGIVSLIAVTQPLTTDQAAKMAAYLDARRA